MSNSLPLNPFLSVRPVALMPRQAANKAQASPADHDKGHHPRSVDQWATHGKAGAVA